MRTLTLLPALAAATGLPPFYTNNIFQLVNLIVKDAIKWPADMDADLRSFLQGLLTKDPRKRLSWPAIAHHNFLSSVATELQQACAQGVAMVLRDTSTPDVAHELPTILASPLLPTILVPTPTLTEIRTVVPLYR